MIPTFWILLGSIKAGHAAVAFELLQKRNLEDKITE